MNSHRLTETGSLQHEACTLPFWAVLIATRAHGAHASDPRPPRVALAGILAVNGRPLSSRSAQAAVGTSTQPRLGFG
jgi:hypothetical protein